MSVELGIIIICSFLVGALLGSLAMLVGVALAQEARRADEAARDAALERQVDAEVVSIEGALRDRLEQRGWDVS